MPSRVVIRAQRLYRQQKARMRIVSCITLPGVFLISFYTIQYIVTIVTCSINRIVQVLTQLHKGHFFILVQLKAELIRFSFFMLRRTHCQAMISLKEERRDGAKQGTTSLWIETPFFLENCTNNKESSMLSFFLL